MTFRIGQKVVCVDAESHGLYLPTGMVSSGAPTGLVKGAIYTVCGFVDFYGTPEILLEEIARVKSPSATIANPGFASARFRPVVKSEFDLSVFTRMLKNEKASA